MAVPLPDTLNVDVLVARGLPPVYADMVRAYEAELDITWPKWRQRAPFGHLQYDHLARVKWLLKRRSLLMTTENGAPAPLDWDVLIVPDTRNPRKCYAHPVMPDQSKREATREPPSPFFSGGQVDPRLLHSRPAANTAEDVAQKTGLPVDLCKEALACKPPRWMDTSVAWVERWVADRPIPPTEAPAPASTVVVTNVPPMPEAPPSRRARPLGRSKKNPQSLQQES